MAYSARSLSTNLLQQAIFQPLHGFTVGQVLKFNGANYVRAQANNLVNAQAIGMVSYVSDADHFYITQAGYISQLSFGVVPGQQYYLSPTIAGAIQLTSPSTLGQYIVPLFLPDTASSGYYFDNAPVAFSSPSAGGFTWSTVTVNTAMTAQNGYIINGAGTLNMTLPAVVASGSLLEIAGSSSSGWVLKLNTGQTVHMGNDDTTTGTSGSVASTNRYDSIRLICSIANTDFVWLSGVGNLTIV